MHLDVHVSDVSQAEQELIALGATRVPGERKTGFRIARRAQGLTGWLWTDAW
jgi:hypothetical protein